MNIFNASKYAAVFVMAAFSSCLLADSTAVFTGVSVEDDSTYYYAGGVFSLNGDVSATGVMLRGSAAYGEYEYDTVGVIGGDVDGEQNRYNVAAGYQLVRDGLLAAAYVGGDYQDHNLSPRDTSNNTDGDRDGIMTHVEVATLGGGNSLGFIGNYSTANETYWARARAGMENSGNTLGLELTASGNASHDSDKFGFFVSAPLAEKCRAELSLGYFETKGNNARGNNTGAYFGVGFSTQF